MTEAIINLQALLVKSHYYSPVGYHGAEALHPASLIGAT